MIEVSTSTKELDREKALVYARADIPKYWIVYGDERMIEVHSRPAPAGYEERRTYSEGRVPSSLLSSRGISTSEIFSIR